jgi:hypothetical protein
VRKKVLLTPSIYAIFSTDVTCGLPIILLRRVKMKKLKQCAKYAIRVKRRKLQQWQFTYDKRKERSGRKKRKNYVKKEKKNA